MYGSSVTDDWKDMVVSLQNSFGITSRYSRIIILFIFVLETGYAHLSAM